MRLYYKIYFTLLYATNTIYYYTTNYNDKELKSIVLKLCKKYKIHLKDLDINPNISHRKMNYIRHSVRPAISKKVANYLIGANTENTIIIINNILTDYNSFLNQKNYKFERFIKNEGYKYGPKITIFNPSKIKRLLKLIKQIL